MKKVILSASAIILFAVILCGGCSKNNPTSSTTIDFGTISGIVSNAIDSTALYGATVSTTPATSSVTTNADGRYTISNVTPGNYAVNVSKSDYISKTLNVTVTTNNTATADYSLIANSTIIEWISISAGNFTMGSTAADTVTFKPYAGGEYPQHMVYLDAYQISKYEITNAQYKIFMDSGGYSNSIYWTTDGWTWKTNNNISEPAFWSNGNYNSGTAFPNYPVVGVSWYESYAFCQWSGCRLPTEAQWEKAARGTDSSNYWPWGSTWSAIKCNSNSNSYPDTFTCSSPVGFFSTGTSPYGAYDMAGNAFEWCNDWYQSDYYSISPSNNPTGPASGTGRVLRGGSWGASGIVCRTAYHPGRYPVSRDPDQGFRPAK